MAVECGCLRFGVECGVVVMLVLYGCVCFVWWCGICSFGCEQGYAVPLGRDVSLCLFVSPCLLTGDTENGSVHDSCDLLSSLSGHIVLSSFVCALSDLRFICVTAFMAQEDESPEFHRSW